MSELRFVESLNYRVDILTVEYNIFKRFTGSLFSSLSGFHFFKQVHFVVSRWDFLRC